MAKKTAKDTTATVSSKAAAKVAAEALRQNPDIKEVHVTSDGTAFYSRNDAQNHAKSLSNHEVFSSKRGEVAIKAPTTGGEETPVAIPQADSEPERDELTGEIINDETEKVDE